eukprot:5363547-Pyramimonas_sp.AAC.1
MCGGTETPDPAKELAKSRKGAMSEKGAKAKLFNPKVGINIDDATRERVVPTADDIDKMEPVVFMELKR